MSKEIRALVMSILEKHLESIISQVGTNTNSLYLLGEIAEELYNKGNFGAGGTIRTANEILIPRIFSRFDVYTPTSVLKEKITPEDIAFGATFWGIRDFVLFSSQLEGGIEWVQNQKVIKIKVEDPTIFRQLFSEQENFFLNSKDTKHSSINYDKIIKLLKGTEHFDYQNPNVRDASALILKEVDKKFFSFFRMSLPIAACN